MLKKNTGSQNLTFALVNATNGAALTGATVTARRSIDGAAQATAGGSVSELGNGQYNFAPSQADTNGDLIGYLFTAANAIPVNLAVRTTAADLADTVRLGLTALPNAAAEAAGGLYTRGSGVGQINQSNSGQIDANAARTGGTTNTGRDIGASVLLSPGTGTGQVSLTSGAVTVGTNNDKTGYSLTQAFPSNFASLGINASGHVSRVVLVDTLTTYTSNTPQTGDSFARLGAPAGASIAADIATRAPSSTALSTAQWTNGRAANLDNLDAAISVLTGRLTSARAGYLDNLNVGGVVASQADVNALNQSASRRVILQTVGQLERPESGSTTYTVEARTYDGDGAAVDADSTPTLTGTGATTGSLAANIGAATNPATGVYRWAYAVGTAHNLEPIRFDLSAVIGGSTFTMSFHTQTVDFVAAEWTTTDQNNLTAIFNKLPANGIADQNTLSAVATQVDEIYNGVEVLGVTVNNVAPGAIAFDSFGASAISVASIDPAVFAGIAEAVRDVNNAAPAVNSLGAAVANAVTATGAIQAKTDQMVFGTANRLNVQVYGMEANTVTASALADDAGTEIGNKVWLSGSRTLTSLGVTVDANVVSWVGNAVSVADDTLTPVVSVGGWYDAAEGSTQYVVADSVAGLMQLGGTFGGTGTVPASPTLAEIIGGVLAGGDIDSLTLEESQKLVLAILLGRVSGAGTGTEVFRAADNSKARVTSTVDESGNRTNVVLDATG